VAIQSGLIVHDFAKAKEKEPAGTSSQFSKGGKEI
jgi:hypothetical protein